MKISRLHEEFIDKARRPMSFGKLPVLAKNVDVPIIATNKWVKSDGALNKTYVFRMNSQRNDFIREMLEHEEEVGHHGRFEIKHGSVSVFLQTKDVEQITELDKEFAKWLDELYKDVVYSLSHD